MKTTTKKQIAESVSRQTLTFLRPMEVTEVINLILTEIKEAVKAGNQVTLRGFGTIRPKVQKACMKQNIVLKKTAFLPEKNTVKFLTSKNFLNELNQ